MPKYFVTPPIKGGYAYWSVRVRESVEYGPNFAVATFFRGLPNAEGEARGLAERLNAR